MQFYCMVMRINIDCNGCYRKVRKALLDMHGKYTKIHRFSSKLQFFFTLFFFLPFSAINTELETHLIEKKQSRVSVCGKFIPQDVAIKIRNKTNRRVEILDIQELVTNTAAAAAADADNQNNQENRTLISSSSWSLLPSQTQMAPCVT
uniref:HMA domain-containing protein n=1 Tax=Manihot esculenta TaxID=3983 RepID=A0A2C9VY84_MANES